MQRSIDAPPHEWLTETEAMAYLRLESAALFEGLVDAGYIPAVRRLNRQTRLFHWKGLVVFQWRLELGDVEMLETGRGSRRLGTDSGKLADSGG